MWSFPSQDQWYVCSSGYDTLLVSLHFTYQGAELMVQPVHATGRYMNHTLLDFLKNDFGIHGYGMSHRSYLTPVGGVTGP